MSNTKENKGLNISAKSFIVAISIIFGLMVVCFILTFVVQAGMFDRNADGEIIEGTYHTVANGNLPWWKWILSPFIALGSGDGLTIIVVLVFLLIIGGVFNSLNNCGLTKYMVDKISFKFGKSKYVFMAVIMLFFMAMGSLIGSFEEVVPLVPIVVAIAIKFGWDTLTGIAMSLLAVGCGFAAGVLNPFTVGIAQKLAGVPMFSGAWLRLVAFALIYGLLFLYVFLHAKKVERKVEIDTDVMFVKQPKLDKGIWTFAIIMGVGILTIICSTFIPFLQTYTTIIIALMFLVAGVSASLVSGMSLKDLCKYMLKGVIGMLPAALLVMMAYSIKFILEESRILDTILNSCIGAADKMPRWCIILFIYLLVLFMNFFVASGSAKAAMLIPLIVPLAKVFEISPQLCILAFAFGDGFSNVFYPTNPVLIISLGLVDTGYGKWVKYSWLFQILTLIITAGLLLFGLAVGYN